MCAFLVLFMVETFVVICKLCFERCFCKTKAYIATFICATFATSAWYIRLGIRHLFCNGLYSNISQLHSYSVFLGHNNLLLCDEIIDDMLLMQLQLTFTMFLLEILCNLLDFGKCCFNNFRNVLPIFVLMLREKRGLNEIILLFCYFLLVLSLVFIFGMKTKGSLTPLSFNASEYIGVAF